MTGSAGNAGKWGSVEAVRGPMNWTDPDTAYNFAKSNHIPFEFHTLIWGQAAAACIDSLPADQQLPCSRVGFHGASPWVRGSAEQGRMYVYV